ncbi:MAG: flagellin [Alphaproteobacteria bacterium]|nr:flagellin [Alphaproteobacteria bacterium]
MTSDVVLTSAMRTNLLSLQGTQSNIDKVQNALATGLKVSSALDNPQNFFASESLKNRSADLSRLLDGMGQSIQTIKAADKGSAALTKLLDQGESLANEALTTLGSGGNTASITGNVVFKADKAIDDYANIAGGETVNLQFTDANGEKIVGGNLGAGGTNGTVTLTAGNTVEEVMSQINALRDGDDNQVAKASLTAEGFLKIEGLTGGDMTVTMSTATLDEGLGFSAYGTGVTSADTDWVADDANRITVRKDPTISSFSLYKSTGELADRTTLLTAAQFKNAGGTQTAVASGFNDAGDTLFVSVNGQQINPATNNVTAGPTMSIQSFVDGINNNAAINTQIEASFNENTAQIEIRALTSNVKSIQIGALETAAADTSSVNFGFSGDNAAATTELSLTDTNHTGTYSVAFGEGAGQLAQLESDYNAILEQVNQLVADSGYRGVNLMAGDTMETFFNEDRTSSLSTIGQDLSTTGLGLTTTKFASTQSIADITSELRAAKETNRNFGSALANSLSVIQTREDFTKGMIATLTEGSDKLTVADQNEEGAKLLALQTRQQLGVTSLSLASQAQQAVLRLF